MIFDEENNNSKRQRKPGWTRIPVLIRILSLLLPSIYLLKLIRHLHTQSLFGHQITKLFHLESIKSLLSYSVLIFEKKSTIMFARNLPSFILIAACFLTLVSSFSFPSPNGNVRQILTSTPVPAVSSTQLWMADEEKSRKTKKGISTIIMDKIEEETEDEEIKEEMWRVVLHNDEVHTFNYVIRSLSKVIGTLDKKASFEICVETHGVGKATVTKSWKKQAEQFCLGLQRQGLTVSISPDKDFEGGHAGGGL